MNYQRRVYKQSLKREFYAWSHDDFTTVPFRAKLLNDNHRQQIFHNEVRWKKTLFGTFRERCIIIIIVSTESYRVNWLMHPILATDRN